MQSGQFLLYLYEPDNESYAKSGITLEYHDSEAEIRNV